MSLDRCLAPLLAEGKIDKDLHDEALGLFEDLQRDYRRQFGDQTAAAMATSQALRQLERMASRKRFLAGLKIQARQRIDFELRGGGRGGGGDGSGGAGGGGPVDPRAGPAFFAPQEGYGMANLEGRRQAIERRAFALYGKLLQNFHTDAFGRVRNEAQLQNVVREIFGQDTGDEAAAAMAKAWGASSEMLRQRFNAAGGDIGRLSNGKGYLPQAHDPLRVRQVKFEEWFGVIEPLLDRAAMIDNRTGLPFSDAALDLTLREVYENIRSDGWFKREPGQRGVGMLANQRSDPRFLQFKDADSWLAYNDKFGRNSPYDAMLGHTKGLSRDIAAMEVFGPNPQDTVTWLQNTIEKDAAIAPDKGEAAKAAEGPLSRMEALWGEYTGLSRRPGKEWLASTGRLVRSYEVSRTLGSAIVSAFPGDIGTQHMAAGFYDLPFIGIMKNQFAMLKPKNAEHRQMAAQMGLVFEGWTNRSAAQMRALSGADLGAGRMARVAETVLRSTGLMAWTDTGQAAFGMTVLGHMASMRNRGFDDLDAGFRKLLGKGGITASDWDAIRATPVRKEQGQEWLFAQDIADQELGDRVLSMLAREENFAVQEADFETRAILHDNLRSGTVIGETAQTSLLLKSFGLSMMLQHGRRVIAMDNWQDRAGYVTRAMITLTLAGAVTIQLRELAKGRDPRDMTDWKFWAEAMLQGGGWGMVGDLFKLVADPRLDSWAKWLAGPAGDTIADVGGLVGKTAQHALYKAGLADKDANAGAALVKVARDQLPGNNLWYARLVFNRWVIDQLRSVADPHYRDSWKAMDRAAKEDGTDYWFSPGDFTPGRAPDMSNAINGTSLDTSPGAGLMPPP